MVTLSMTLSDPDHPKSAVFRILDFLLYLWIGWS